MTPSPPASASCANPVDAAVLMDYWLAALPSDEEQAVEEHLMTCDSCGDRLREMIALSEGLRALAQSGSLVVVISDRLVTHAEEIGQHVRHTRRRRAAACTAPCRPTTTCSSLAWPPT